MYINELGINIRVSSSSENSENIKNVQSKILNVVKEGKIKELVDILNQDPNFLTLYNYLYSHYPDISLANLDLTVEYVKTLETLMEKNPDYFLPYYHSRYGEEVDGLILDSLSKKNLDTFGVDIMSMIEGGIAEDLYDLITSNSKLMDILKENSERTQELVRVINEYNEHCVDCIDRDIDIEGDRCSYQYIINSIYYTPEEILPIQLKQILGQELTKEEVDKLEWRKEQNFDSMYQLHENLYIDTEKIEVKIEDIKKKNIKVLLVPRYMDKTELENQSIKPDATVEAEYGDKVIEGEKVTLAHHTKKYADNPAPCNTQVSPLQENSTIVVSHLDLDTIGGIAALMGVKMEDDEFWKLAEFIDLNGLHRLREYQGLDATKISYLLYNAYQDSNRLPGVTDITDITDTVLQHIEMIDRSILHDEQLVRQAREWKQARTRKISDSLIYENKYMRVFYAKNGEFCSDSYYSKESGRIVPCTIVMNGKDKSITLALEDGGKSLQEQQPAKSSSINKFRGFFTRLFRQKAGIQSPSARDIVQHFWGGEAGGHEGIAGSPRGQEMTLLDFKDICMTMFDLYNKKEHYFSKPEAMSERSKINSAIKMCTRTKPDLCETIKYKVQRYVQQYDSYTVPSKQVEENHIEDWELE